MFNLIKGMASGFLFLLFLVGITGIFLSNEFVIERKIEIQGTPQEIHDFVGDWKRWSDWEPQGEPGAPPLKIKIEGDGKEVGSSRSVSTEDTFLMKKVLTYQNFDEGIRYDVFYNEDHRPWQNSIYYRPFDGRVEVTWKVEGRVEIPVIGSYIAKTLDQSIGKGLLDGLGNLKRLVETR